METSEVLPSFMRTACFRRALIYLFDIVYFENQARSKTAEVYVFLKLRNDVVGSVSFSSDGYRTLLHLFLED